MGPDASVSSIEFKSETNNRKYLTSVKVNYLNAPWQSSPAFELEGYMFHGNHKTIPVH